MHTNCTESDAATLELTFLFAELSAYNVWNSLSDFVNFTGLSLFKVSH